MTFELVARRTQNFGGERYRAGEVLPVEDAAMARRLVATNCANLRPAATPARPKPARRPRKRAA